MQCPLFDQEIDTLQRQTIGHVFTQFAVMCDNFIQLPAFKAHEGQPRRPLGVHSQGGCYALGTNGG